jgi:hypothetical protein
MISGPGAVDGGNYRNWFVQRANNVLVLMPADPLRGSQPATLTVVWEFHNCFTLSGRQTASLMGSMGLGFLDGDQEPGGVGVTIRLSVLPKDGFGQPGWFQ